MPTTTTIDTDIAVNAIGARTDFAGTAVTDVSAEEFRFNHELISEGILKPADAFQVVAGGAATMDVVVGSGAAKTDYAFVDGDISGQGDYLVRLDDVSKTITLSAPDASQDRTDEIYLVVLDDAYDSSTFALPVLAVREGDVGGGDPGPDSSWESYMLLASVLVPGGSADITEATVTDERVQSELAADIVGSSAIQTSAVDTDELADDSVTQTKIGPDAVGTTELADDAVTGDKADNSFFQSFEVDNSTELNTFRLNDDVEKTVASVTLSIPTDWNSWKCVVHATWSATQFGTGGDFVYSIHVEIDGAAQQEMTNLRAEETVDPLVGAITARRTGMTTTGNRTINLKAIDDVSAGDLNDIHLYARAVRTS